MRKVQKLTTAKECAIIIKWIYKIFCDHPATVTLQERGENMSFIVQYLLHPRSVGAVKPSSKHLAKKMVEDVNFCKARCIAELGAGTGVFTEEVVKAKRDETVYLVFEINDAFYRTLNDKYGSIPNVHIIHDSAEKLASCLAKYGFSRSDYILSGLPFASLPKETSDRILRECRRCLTAGGSFITFQYTRLKLPLFRKYFAKISLKKENRNVPPAYIMNCKNGRKKKNGTSPAS